MMILILLELLGFAQPEDVSTYYGMDMNWAEFSCYWEQVYETSPHGFRTSQGSHDLKRWYQTYEAKTEVGFGRIFSLRYNLSVIYDFDVSIHEHRFEPTLRVAPELYLHLVMVPFYFKNQDEAGIGLAWRRGSTDWLALYGIVQNLEHNLSIYYVREGPERDPYRRVPFKLELDARVGIDWARLRLHGELGTRSNQYLDWPDSIQYVWDQDRDRSSAWGRLELKPAQNLWLGTRFGWRRDRSQTRWPGREGADTLTADTLRNFWVEPFISLYPTERFELRCQYRIWDTHRDMDSVSYYRDYDVLTALASWHPLPTLWFEAGYQRSWRYRYNNDTLIPEPYSGVHPGTHVQSRLVFNLEMRFESGFMFIIKEGLEMDFFPQGLFRSPHNHTNVAVYLPLGFIYDHGRSKN